MLARALRSWGRAFFALLAVMTVGVTMAVSLVAPHLAVPGLVGPSVPVGLACVGGLALALALALGPARRPLALALAHPAAPWLGLGVLLLGRAAVALAFDGPLVSDFLEYHRLAERVLALGRPFFSELRPMGYPVLLAGAMKLFGGAAPALLNLAAMAATGALLWRVGKRWASPAAGAGALWLYALSPAQALGAPLTWTEPLYAALLLGAFALAAEAAAPDARRPVAAAALAGLLLGASQCFRPTSLALLPVLALLPWIVRPGRRALAPALALALAALLALAPVGAWHLKHEGRLSLSTSSYGGWSLLVGTNPRSNGAWNAADAASVAHQPSLAARDRLALALAIERLKADPAAFAALAVRKQPLMWANEDYGAFWLFGAAGPRLPLPALGALYALCQAFGAFVAVLAACALWRRDYRPSPFALGAFGGLGVMAIAHTFLEVQSRYHAYWVPFFCCLAAQALAGPAPEAAGEGPGAAGRARPTPSAGTRSA